MPTNERLVVQVDAIGNFSNVIGEVGKFRSQLQSLKLPDKLTAKLEKGFDNVESKVSHFQSLLNKGITTKGDFSKLVSSARSAETAINGLKDDIKSVGDKDIQIAVANSADIKKAEEELQKILNMEKQLSSFGTTKGKGSFGEKEVADMQKLANTSEGLRKRFNDVTKAIETGNIEQASAAIEKLIAHAQKYQAIAERNGKSTEKWDSTITWAQGAQTQIDGLVNKAQQAKVAFEQIQVNKFNQMKGSVDGIATGFSNVANNAKQAINATTEMYSRTTQLNEQVSHLRTQANYFFGLQNVGRLIARGIREAAESVRDLDKAMTDTAVVTDFSVHDMWNMLPEYTKLANKLGATTQGAYETMTLYFQQGLNKTETFEIGEETMKMARIAGLDYAQTTNMMTAALRGFNMELNQTSAKRVNDVYSELAAITASDTRELGLAMERTASIAHSAGMDFGNTTAFLAQMIETTREAPENLGTAMKTIIARFQELKENPYEISEVEGEEVNFNRVDKALKSIGVDLMDNRDKFRDLDDVFMDISSRWDGLSQTTQRYIATIAAGSRQQSRFLAMVQNYDRLKELTDAAANSEGASEVQFAKTLESYEAKVNKLKNAWQAFTMSLANNQAVKLGVDTLQKIITFGNKIIETFGKVGSIFGETGKGIAEMAAAFGLGAVGFKGLKSGANAGLGVLARMTNANAANATKMFTGGFSGGDAATGKIATKITNPIISAIDRVVAAINKEPFKNSQYQDAVARNQMLNKRQKNLYDLMSQTSDEPRTTDINKRKTIPQLFSASDVNKQIADLTKEEQLAMKQNMPLLTKILQDGHSKAFKKLNLSDSAQQTVERYGKAIDAEVDRGNISWSDSLTKKFDAYEVGNAIGGETGKEIFNALDKELDSSKYTNAKYTEKFRRDALKAGLKDQKDIDEFIKNRQRQTIAQDKGKASNLNIINTSGLNVAERKINAFASTTSRAGQAVMGLGMAMSAAGFPAFGAIFSTIGNGIMGIGMAAEGAAIAGKNMGKAFKWIKHNPWVLAATAAIAGIALIIKHQKKIVEETRKSGNKVVKEYSKITDRTKKELDNIKIYQESWGTWTQGIDSSGNNIGLGTAEYEDYLKAVKEITNAHPELIKGYNSLGNAIVDNNTVLQEATRIAKEEQKEAEKAYLTRASGQKIVEKQRTYKRWKKGNDNATITAEEYARSGGSYAYDPRTKGSDLVKKATEITNAIKAVKGGDELLKQYGITFDKLGNITEEGIENLRVHGGDLDKALPNLFGDTLSKAEEKTADNINDKIAEFGEITSGLEAASKDYFDWGWEYAASKGYDQIDSNLLIPFKTSIERIAEKGLDAGDFQKEIDKLGKTYQDLGGHAQDFSDIQTKVDEAVEQFGKDQNVDAYEKTVTKATKSLDNWIKELESHEDQASKILAEYLKSYKESVLNISENIPTLEETFNTESGNIAAANATYENWQKQNEGGDYYTAADNFHKMYEEVNDDIDNLGKGSKQWWSAMTATLSNDYVFSHTKDEIEKHSETIDSFFKEGKEGAQNFMRYLSSDEVLGKKLDPQFFPKGKTLGDYIIKDEQGNLNFDKLMELSPDQMNSIANSAGMAGEAWTAAFNKAMQFYDIDFSNIDQMYTAIAASDTTLRGTGSAKDSMYMRLSDYQQAGLDAGVAPNKINENQKLLENMGVTFVDKLNKSNLSKYIKDWGINQGKVTQGKEEFNTTKAYDFIASLNKLGYNKDEISNAYESNKALISDYDSADFNQLYSNMRAAEDPATNSVMSIEGTTQGILSAVNSIALGMGILTKDSSQQIDNATEKANNFNDSLGAYENYKDYKSEFEQTRNELQTTHDQLMEAAEKHGEDTEYGQELKAKAEEVQEALDALGDGLSKQEFKDLQETQNYAEQLQNTTSSEGGIDIGKMLKIDPATLSEKGQELQQLFNQAFSAEDTKAGITSAVTSAESLINTLSQSGTEGVAAAQELKAAFIDANSNGLSKMDGASLANVLNKLDLTKKDVEELANEHPEIDFDANVENVDGKWVEKKQEIEGNPIEATVDIKSGKGGGKDGSVNFLPNKEQLGESFKELQSHLQEFKSHATSDAPEVGVETDKADSKIQTLLQKMETFKKSATAKASVGIDVSGAKKLNNAAKNVKNLSNTKSKANIGLDSSKVTSGVNAASDLLKKFGNKTAKAAIGIKDNASSKLSSISSAVNRFDNKSVTATVNISPNYTGTWKKTVYVKEEKVHTGGLITNSGVAYRAKGGTIAIPRFKKKGTDIVPAMLTPGEYVQNREAVNYFGIDFMRKINHKDLSGALQSFGSAANGNRKGTLGPNNKGGLTLTGERGFEVAWIPSQNKSMILGAKGPQMIELPKDTIVWSHEQSKKILKNNSINAGSYGVRGTAKNDWYTVSSGSKSSSSKKSSGSKSSSKKNSSKKSSSSSSSSKTTIIIEYSGDVSVWWENQIRKVDATQRKVDSLLKKFEDELKRVGTTRKSIQSITNSYKKQLNHSIALNKTSKKVAEKGLYNLNYSTSSSKRTISYDVTEKTTKKDKKGKTTTSYNKKSKETKVSLSNYIKYDKTNDTYVIDQDAIDRVSKGYYYKDSKGNRKWAKGNASKGKAIKEAAEKEINDKLSKRNTAIDNITKAQEALKKINNDIYESFYRWEKSITRVYILSQKLEELTKRLSIAGSQVELQFAKLEAGINKNNGLTKIKEALTNERELLLSQAKAQNTNVNAAKVAFQNSLNFSTYAKKYLNNLNSTEAKGDYLAAKKAFDLLDKLNFENGEFNYASAISALNKKQYNEETNNRIKDVLDKIFEKQNDYLDAINDAYQAQTEIYQKIEEIQSFIAEFEQDLLSGIEEQAEDQVRRLDKLNSALSKAFKDLIDEVKSRLDDRRKKEDNAKTESDIAKKQQRLAALRADTSGGHAVEIAQLEKEIAEAQQNYQRTLEDQLLERLQEQGDKAEKQRQRQIDLLELQNEIAKQTGSNLAEVKEWLKNPEANKEQIRQAWLANKNYDEATPGERTQLEQEFESEWAKYLAYNEQLPKYQNTVTSKMDKLENTLNSIAKNLLKVTGSRSARELRQAGLSAKQLRKLGYDAKSLKRGGYTAKELKNAGYSAKSIRKAGYSIQDFRKAGFSAKQLRKLGYDAKSLKRGGYTAKELKNAEYSAKSIRKAGYSIQDFKEAGFSAKQAVKAGYSKEKTIKAYNYTAAKGMIDLNASGKTVQKAKGVSAGQIQKIINKNPKDNATQKDLAGVQVGKVDVNGKKKGGEIKDSHISATGKRVGANKGSYLYTANWDTKKGKITGGWTTWNLNEFTADLIKKYPIDASQALVYAIQNREIGSFLNKNFKSLVSAAKISGKEYKLNDRSITGIIGANGYIYYNTSSGGVKRWDPSKGKVETIKYSKDKFLKYAKQNNTYSKVYAQALIKKGAYTKSQLQKNGVKKFATGGLADSTGLAWLDGTPSKPELVLDAQDTKNFLTLRDVLDKAIGSTNAVENTYGGDTSYEININVDHINNDYDVDRIAERVKKNIIKDANYRNVVRVRNLR